MTQYRGVPEGSTLKINNSIMKILELTYDRVVVDLEGHRITWWEESVFLNGRPVSPFHPFVVMARRQFIRLRERSCTTQCVSL
jgi:hypothetical protein